MYVERGKAVLGEEGVGIHPSSESLTIASRRY